MNKPQDAKIVKAVIVFLQNEKIVVDVDTVFVHFVNPKVKLSKYFFLKDRLVKTKKSVPCDDKETSRNRCLFIHVINNNNEMNFKFTNGGSTTGSLSYSFENDKCIIKKESSYVNFVNQS